MTVVPISVTRSRDLPDPKLIISCPCLVDHLCQFASNQFTRFENTVFTSLVTNERMEGRTFKQTNKQTNKQTDRLRIQ